MRFALALALLLTTSAASAGTLEPRKRPYAAISTLTAAAFNGGVWTGWIDMRDYSAVCFKAFHDYTGNAGVTMRCEMSSLSTTANDSGYDVASYGIASGTVTVSAMTWTRTTGADSRWVQCVDDVVDQFLNCKFDDSSGNNGTDTLTVEYMLVTP